MSQVGDWTRKMHGPAAEPSLGVGQAKSTHCEKNTIAQKEECGPLGFFFRHAMLEKGRK